MSNLFLTLVVAFVIIVIAIAGLAIGWLITGRTKLGYKTCCQHSNQKKERSGSLTAYESNTLGERHSISEGFDKHKKTTEF